MDNLPFDLVEEVFNHLDTASWACCKAVCRIWREMLSTRRAPTNEMPWIWNCSYNASMGGHRMTNVSEDADYSVQVPSKMLPKNNSRPFFYQCLGSFGPWLVLILREKKKEGNTVGTYLFNPDYCFLYNPLSSKHFTLPSLHWVENEYSITARLSSLPIESDMVSSRCTVAMYTSDDIYLCKLNDTAWKKVEYSFGDGVIYDAVFQTGENDGLQLYVIEHNGKMTTFQVMGTDVIPCINGTNSHIVWNDDKLLSPGAFFYLVIDALGELLVVGKYEQEGDEVMHDSFGFEVCPFRITVHKLQKGRLVNVDNLGGGMIFLADAGACYCSWPVNSPKFFLKDCVYSLEDDDLDHNHQLQRFPVNRPSLLTPPEVYDVYIMDYPIWFMPNIC